VKSEMEFVEVACVEDLAEGEMIRVDVDGSRVLVAVVEGKPYAMGAVCTHERAFLDEGGVIGHEVTCPLHFSCFDVRTGEVTAPPAEDNAPVYEVKVEDGKVLVSSEPVDEPAGVDERLTPKDDAEAPPATTPAGEAAEETEARFEEAETADEEGAPEVVAVPSAPLLVGPSKTRPTFSERSIGRLGSMSWLRRTSERLTHPASSLRSRPGVLAVLDVLHGRWFGHAIHPPLSDLPIGLWTGAFVLDVAGRDESAKLLGAAGTAGGVAALATGLADWSVTDGQDRRLGLLHGLINTAGLALQGASLAARLLGRRRQARAWSGVGLAVTYASAYLGGHLVMGRGQMVNHARSASGPRNWTPTVRERDLHEGETRTVQIEERDVLLYRSDGVISAIEGACSHAGGPLGRGPVEDGVVTCPWHDSRFDLFDGRVLRGPAQYSQPVLETRFREGWIEIRRRR
jgi:nitrite reductase/ring-hydroxylating ferredoxin subunit/uncharacterized membrane protein